VKSRRRLPVGRAGDIIFVFFARLEPDEMLWGLPGRVPLEPTYGLPSPSPLHLPTGEKTLVLSLTFSPPLLPYKLVYLQYIGPHLDASLQQNTNWI